jgi:hypothetical protein
MCLIIGSVKVEWHIGIELSMAAVVEASVVILAKGGVPLTGLGWTSDWACGSWPALESALAGLVTFALLVYSPILNVKLTCCQTYGTDTILFGCFL